MRNPQGLDRLALFAEGFTGRANPAFRKRLELQEAARRREELKQFGQILSGQSTPAFLRPGGAEGLTPEQSQQLQLNQLAALGSPEAMEILSAKSPLTTPSLEQRKTQLAERKFALEQKKFDQGIREFDRKLKTGGLDQEELFKRGTKLRGEFTTLSKDFIKQRDAFGRIQASAEAPSAAGDLALIFNFMKVLDPGSTVREGEFATAANSAGIPERLRAQYNKVSKGERLSEKQRNDFTDRGEKLFLRANKQHEKRVSEFTGLAERVGVDPQNVLIDLGLADQEAKAEQVEENVPVGDSVLPSQIGQPGEGTIIHNPQTGQEMILRGGQWQLL